MEIILQKAKVHRNEAICHKSIELLADADVIDFIERIKWNVTSVLSAIELLGWTEALLVTEGKTKYVKQAAYRTPDYCR